MNILPGGRRRRIGLLLAFLLLLDLLWVFMKFPWPCRGRVHRPWELPPDQGPVLVLGAGVQPDREPTPILEGRLRVALELHQRQRAPWILVSGDNRTSHYNEPRAMRKWLLRQGIPPERILSDFAGRRTYDSLRRARDVFGLRKLVVVTSDFHMARAIYLGRHLGLDIQGVSAPTTDQSWGYRANLWVREYFARHKALWDCWFPPDTLLGPPETTPEEPRP